MAYDEKLAARVRTLLKDGTGFKERKMFGGLAFMYRGRICFGIVGRDLVVRFPRMNSRLCGGTGMFVRWISRAATERIRVRVATGIPLAADASSMARARAEVCEGRCGAQPGTQTPCSEISHRQTRVGTLT
jgi:hypothetical protein